MLKVNKKVLSVLLLNLILLNQPALAKEIDLGYQVVEIDDERSFPKFLKSQDGSLWVNDVADAINSLPESVVNKFNKKGLKITLVASEGWLEKKFHYKSVRGVTIPDEKKIYTESFVRKGIKQKMIDKGCPEEWLEGETDETISKRQVIDNILHELGHYYDSINGYYSKSKSFKKIYKNEKNSYKKTRHYRIENRSVNQNIDSAVEYFATCFSCYRLNPEDLQYYCPDTFNFFNDKLELYNIKCIVKVK